MDALSSDFYTDRTLLHQSYLKYETNINLNRKEILKNQKAIDGLQSNLKKLIKMGNLSERSLRAEVRQMNSDVYSLKMLIFLLLGFALIVSLFICSRICILEKSNGIFQARYRALKLSNRKTTSNKLRPHRVQ